MNQVTLKTQNFSLAVLEEDTHETQSTQQKNSMTSFNYEKATSGDIDANNFSTLNISARLQGQWLTTLKSTMNHSRRGFSQTIQ